jgi:hypothetical protein
MAAMIGPRVDTPLQPFIFQTYRNRVSVPFEFDFGAAATAGKSVTKANAATKFQCDTVTLTHEYRTWTKRNATGLL